MNPVKIYLHFKLLISCKKAKPIGLLMFFLGFFFLGKLIDQWEDVLCLFHWLIMALWGDWLGRIIILHWVYWIHVHVHGLSHLSHLPHLVHTELIACRLLSFPLITKLIVDIWVHSGNLFIVHQKGNFTFPISKLVPLWSQFLSSPISLSNSFILNQSVSPGSGQLVPFDL